MFFSIKRKLIGTHFLVAFLSVILFTFIVSRLIISRIEDGIREKTLKSLVLAYNAYERIKDDMGRYTVTIGKSPEVVELTKKGNYLELKSVIGSKAGQLALRLLESTTADSSVVRGQSSGVNISRDYETTPEMIRYIWNNVVHKPGSTAIFPATGTYEFVEMSKAGIVARVMSTIYSTDGGHIGMVIASEPIDNVFADRMKDLTDTDVIIYVDGKISTSTLFDNDGKRLIGIQHPKYDQILHTLKAGEEYFDEVVLDKWSYSMGYRPLYDKKGEILGVMAVAISREQIAYIQKITMFTLGAMVVASLVITLIISTIISTRISAPIRALEKSAKELASGNWNQRVEVTTKDEVGELAKEFNFMSKALSEHRQRLEQKIIELDTINKVNKEIGSSFILDEVLKLIVDSIKNVISCQSCSLLLVDENTGDLVVQAATETRDVFSRTKFKRGMGISGWVMNNKQPALINDVTKDPRYMPPYRDVKSVIVVPIFSKGEVIGTINVQSNRVNAFTEDNLHLLTTLAGESSIAIENARLYKYMTEKERMEQELRIAATIQLGLLPREMPFVKGLSVYGLMKPAKEVGGDYFDFIEVKKNGTRDSLSDELNICIGDVAGKGVTAGIIMVMARAIIRSLIKNYKSTKDIISETNKLLCGDIGSSKFMTMIVFHWDGNQKRLLYTSAGHEKIIVYRAKEKKCDIYRSGGLAIGLDTDIEDKVEEQEIVLNENDSVVLYTDGVTEAKNSNEEMFSLSRLVAAVEKYGDKEIELMLNLIYRDIKKFIGTEEQYDDITLVGIRREDVIRRERRITLTDLRDELHIKDFFAPGEGNITPEDISVVDVSCNIDLTGAEQLTDFIRTLIKNSKYNIVVDLSKVNYVNSSGLNLLLHSLSQFKKQGANIRFFGLTDYVKDTLHYFVSSALLPVSANKDDAIKSLIESNK